MPRGKRNPRSVRYDSEFKLRVLKTLEEEGLSYEEAKHVYGVSMATLIRWKELFASGGEEAIRKDSRTADHKKQLSDATQAKFRDHVLQTKQKFPFFGIGRIWHWIRRTFFLPVSHRFIRRTLKEEGLLQPVVSRKRNPPQPKRFERARPNQMWQSDITAFNIARGLRVYLIGFMDDHSRYMVGWGLYAGQSGGLVLEVFRNAIATYGRPEELLTDNGRQYKSWQGETDFQRELKREGIKHITSRPHHPQTLGKIEAFWGHMKREFLAHVVMGGLEDMRERMDHWVKYYNFQRPHEGIDNLTPAERYFRFSRIARLEIEKRIRRNEKDLAIGELPPKQIQPVAQLALGDKTLEMKKVGDEFIVILDGQEMSSKDLDSDKEKTDETQKESSGKDPGEGSGGQSQGVAGAPSTGGGKDDQPSVSGHGTQTSSVLQAGGPNGAGDGPNRQDAAASGTGSGSDRGGDDPGGKDGRTETGTPPTVQPDANLKEALPDPRPQNQEIRPPQAQNGSTPKPGGDGADPSTGPSPEGPQQQRSGG
jgi:transposase InsO family protein/transposase-like protein